MDISVKLHSKMVDLYELPISFWKKILGADLHFHLGHFPDGQRLLEDSMRLAVQDLLVLVREKKVNRILDVGCGWGGPAFQLARIHSAEVLGLTISRQQANFINEQAQLYNLPVRADIVDLEGYSFNYLGTFDVLLAYEVLEHIIDRKTVLNRIREASHKDTCLAIAMSCRAPDVKPKELCNQFLGIQYLNTADELIEILEETGWEVTSVKDCTSLTLPVWALWRNNLNRITDREYFDIGRELATALENAGQLYQRNLLQSVQIIAKRGR